MHQLAYEYNLGTLKFQGFIYANQNVSVPQSLEPTFQNIS